MSMRKESLRQLAAHFEIPIRDSIEDCESSSTEDMWLYLAGEQFIERWAAVTYHDGEQGGLHYIKTFANRQEAEDYTVEYVTDDIFTEAPIAVVDLDDPVRTYGKIYPLEKLIPIYAKE